MTYTTVEQIDYAVFEAADAANECTAAAVAGDTRNVVVGADPELVVAAGARFYPCPICKGKGGWAGGYGYPGDDPDELCGACSGTGDGRDYKRRKPMLAPCICSSCQCDKPAEQGSQVCDSCSRGMHLRMTEEVRNSREFSHPFPFVHPGDPFADDTNKETN